MGAAKKMALRRLARLSIACAAIACGGKTGAPAAPAADASALDAPTTDAAGEAAATVDASDASVEMDAGLGGDAEAGSEAGNDSGMEAGVEAGAEAGCEGGACIATAVTVGGEQACALLATGTVMCWGDNATGAIGDGTSTGPQSCNGYPCAATPAAVTALSGVLEISAGGVGGNNVGPRGTCALLADHTVWCWGDNLVGELGDGTSTGPQVCSGMPCSTVPAPVSGLSGVTAITRGAFGGCALLSSGTVACWGDNREGQLGNGTSAGPDTCNGGTMACSTTPVAVTGLSGVMAVSAGVDFTCALLTNGTVACWGDNEAGQLGNGTSSGQMCTGGFPCSPTPGAVAGLSGVTAIAAGGDFACALLSGGTVACWGFNGDGELGLGDNTGPKVCGASFEACSTTPVAVPGLSGVTAIAAGEEHACALRSNGTVACWGLNQSGQLGGGMTAGPQMCNGALACSLSPVDVSGLSSATAIAAGTADTCALVSGGGVVCWGDNESCELGNDNAGGPQTCGLLACSSVPIGVPGL